MRSRCEERREDLGDGRERAGAEVGDLDAAAGRRRVGERPGPAEVVQVVPSAADVRPVDAEAGDRAVDDVVGDVLGADAEPGRDARPEAFDDDVGLRTEGPPELGLCLQVADDRLLARR